RTRRAVRDRRNDQRRIRRRVVAMVPQRPAPPKRPHRGGSMIVCWRTVTVRDDERDRFLAWIIDNRTVREEHGLCAELVLEPPDRDGDTVVVTIWPSHEVFDAWIATPERDRLTDSDVHRAV